MKHALIIGIGAAMVFGFEGYSYQRDVGVADLVIVDDLSTPGLKYTDVPLMVTVIPALDFEELVAPETVTGEFDLELTAETRDHQRSDWEGVRPFL